MVAINDEEKVQCVEDSTEMDEEEYCMGGGYLYTHAY